MFPCHVKMRMEMLDCEGMQPRNPGAPARPASALSQTSSNGGGGGAGSVAKPWWWGVRHVNINLKTARSIVYPRYWHDRL
jgi:hypothetical protein